MFGGVGGGHSLARSHYSAAALHNKHFAKPSQEELATLYYQIAIVPSAFKLPGFKAREGRPMEAAGKIKHICCCVCCCCRVALAAQRIQFISHAYLKLYFSNPVRQLDRPDSRGFPSSILSKLQHIAFSISSSGLLKECIRSAAKIDFHITIALQILDFLNCLLRTVS